MMQPPSNSSSKRSHERRSPQTADAPIRAMSPNEPPRNPAPPPASRFMQNGISRRQHSNMSGPPLSQIEKSVTHLLVATKQLLETLTQWSRNKATDAQVSDVYVRLGYEFNIACRAFTAIGVDVNDLGNVPEMLRAILENTLSQEASVESLDRYLPRIRDIIINLLHGLKRKQQKLRLTVKKDGEGSRSINGHHHHGQSTQRGMSELSMNSTASGLTTLLNEQIPAKYRTAHASDPRETTLTSIPDRNYHDRDITQQPQMNNPAPASPNANLRASHRTEDSSLSSNAAQTIPILQPSLSSQDFSQELSSEYIPMPIPPPDVNPLPKLPSERSHETFDTSNFPPPPLPPKTDNALLQLQRGGELERRASRRYSAYQISKVMGVSPNGLPAMPLPQNSPIPNRMGVRESMNAVRVRGPQLHSSRTLHSNRSRAESPQRKPRRISEESGRASPNDAASEHSRARTPEDKIRQDDNHEDFHSRRILENDDPAVHNPNQSDATIKQRTANQPKSARASTEERLVESPSNLDRPFVPETSPQPGKELTVFLQYKTKIKKYVLTDGYNELSLARLQLAFIEKFQWNTHSNGNDLPEIYIQDPVSGVRHELEDLADIKDRSVLVLNIEALDEVKRHIDDGLGGLRTMVEEVKASLDAQQASIQRVSESQQEAAKEMASLAAVQPQPSRGSLLDNPKSSAKSLNPTGIVANVGQMNELQSLRRDLAVLRQTYSGFQADVKSSMDNIRTKASTVKATAVKASIPDLKGPSGRAYVIEGKKKLAADSDTLVNRVDDLQDIVEDLRKDVVMRGVRPLPRQLESVAKDISIATQELKKMQETLKREKPLWTKIWERELEVVCLDREDLTMQEDLAADLQDDLEKAQQTFSLVEEATKEQMKEMPQGTGVRNVSRALNHITVSDPLAVKEGVLDEVRALQPNHENRLEAIERAEKLRQKDLASRSGDEFQRELGDFVGEGRLKKAGGVDEVERARKAKDERIRREVWERQNGMSMADSQNAVEPATDGGSGGVEEDKTPANTDGEGS